MSDHHRYKEFEQTMLKALLICLALFIAALFAGGAGIGWLKVVLAVLTMGGSVLGLAVLYRSKDLLRQRSLWLSCGYFSVAVCTLVSLILNYP